MVVQSVDIVTVLLNFLKTSGNAVVVPLVVELLLDVLSFEQAKLPIINKTIPTTETYNLNMT